MPNSSLDNDDIGYLIGERLYYSNENNHLYLKGDNISVKYQDNNVSGSGSYSFLGKVDYLQVNGTKILPNTKIEIAGKKCTIKQISKADIITQLGLDKTANAYEIIITEK
jgi:hypothetical protein